MHREGSLKIYKRVQGQRMSAVKLKYEFDTFGKKGNYECITPRFNEYNMGFAL